jgi:hypothetical protein
MVTSPFLAEKQMTVQILVFKAQINAVVSVTGKCTIVSFALHYKNAGISVTCNITFCQ